MKIAEESILHQFNLVIGQWISFLDDYTLEMLCRQPAPASWSLGQVYIHLINDTNYYVGEMKAAMLTDENCDKVMSDFAKAMFDDNKFPDMAMDNPFADPVGQLLSKDELLQGLILIKGEVNKLFVNPEMKSGKTMHPGFQYFNALEWLQFSEMHMRHHLSQKKKDRWRKSKLN